MNPEIFKTVFSRIPRSPSRVTFLKQLWSNMLGRESQAYLLTSDVFPSNDALGGGRCDVAKCLPLSPIAVIKVGVGNWEWNGGGV